MNIVTLNIITTAGTTVQVERRPFAASTAASMFVSQVSCSCGGETSCLCIDILLEPPYTVQRAYFDREKGIIVSDAGGLSSAGEDGGEGDGDYEDDDFFSGAINPRTGSPSSPTEARARELRALSASLSPRLSQLLLRLLDRLQDRIS